VITEMRSLAISMLTHASSPTIACVTLVAEGDEARCCLVDDIWTGLHRDVRVHLDASRMARSIVVTADRPASYSFTFPLGLRNAEAAANRQAGRVLRHAKISTSCACPGSALRALQPRLLLAVSEPLPRYASGLRRPPEGGGANARYCLSLGARSSAPTKPRTLPLSRARTTRSSPKPDPLSSLKSSAL